MNTERIFTCKIESRPHCQQQSMHFIIRARQIVQIVYSNKKHLRRKIMQSMRCCGGWSWNKGCMQMMNYIVINCDILIMLLRSSPWIIIHDSSKPDKKSQFSSIQCLHSTKFGCSEIEKKTNQRDCKKERDKIWANEHCKRKQFDWIVRNYLFFNNRIRNGNASAFE